MPNSFAGLISGLAPLVCAVAVLLATNSDSLVSLFVTINCWALITLSAIVLGNWLFGLWAFHLASSRAPAQKSADLCPSPKLDFKWSAPFAFPEDFGPLLALKEFDLDAEGVDGSLVDFLCVTSELNLRHGEHTVNISDSASLSVNVNPKQSKKAEIHFKARRPAPGFQAIVTSFSVVLPHVHLGGVAGLLDGIWGLWTREGLKTETIGDAARRICIILLHGLELIFPIQLAAVEGTCVGEELLMFFSGSVGPIPFVRIHLPSFVLPRLHASLESLLSPQPLVGQRLRVEAANPAAHPAIFDSMSTTVEAVCLPVGFLATMQLRDGSVPICGVEFKDNEPLHFHCQAEGKLSDEQLRMELTSFSVDQNCTSDACLRGSANAVLSFSQAVCRNRSATPVGRQIYPCATLADVLFEAQTSHSITVPLDASISVKFDDGSMLPGTLQATFGDEHPLMLGRANVVTLLKDALIHGRCAATTELPMQRKRDLLQLPDVDLHFDVHVQLEEGSSYVDDAFSTCWFQDVSAHATGRIWSETLEKLRVEAKIDGKGRLQAEIRDSSIVQVLHEAESAALRWGPSQQTDTLSTPRLGGVKKHITGFRPEDTTEVKTGDVIHIGVSLKTDGVAHAEVATTGSTMEDKTEANLSPYQSGSVKDLAVKDQSKHFIVSGRGTVAKVELGEVRAQIGDLSFNIPPQAMLACKVEEAFINAEGIGRTRLHASWKDLGRVSVHSDDKQISVVMPALPDRGDVTVDIGDMGHMSLSYDSRVDATELLNRMLDEESMYGPFLQFAAMLNMQGILTSLLNIARVIRNVMRLEEISDLADAIPPPRLARFLARVMEELGTDGRHVSKNTQSSLEVVLLELVQEVIDGKGVDVSKFTRVLWDFLPTDAAKSVKDHMSEVDFLFKWFDVVLRPTEPYQGPDMALASEPKPAKMYHRNFDGLVPHANRMYEAARLPGKTSKEFEEQLGAVSSYLTAKQIEYLLSGESFGPCLRHRLQILLALKQRVEKVSCGYGGPAFMPQGMAVGFFLATAIRGSFATVCDNSALGEACGRSKIDHAPNNTGSSRLAQLLQEQMTVVGQLKELQAYQHRLVLETSGLLGFGGGTPGVGRLSRVPAAMPPSIQANHSAQLKCILECLTHSSQSSPAKAVVRTNAAHAMQNATAKKQQRPVASDTNQERENLDLDLGCSLLGPMEVAILLQSGLAAVPQSRQVQQNQRMLLELLVSQPPIFQRGIFFELSNNGSRRVLSNHLLALLDLKQDAVRPGSRIDVADLLSTALGVQLPCRADFMAGGTHASNSYILFVHRAAKQILDECSPYVALKQWIQRADVSVPPIPVELAEPVERLLGTARDAILDADAAGGAWLKERGPPVAVNALGGATGMAFGDESARKSATALYEIAFSRCKSALKAHPGCLAMAWFKGFWTRNYDALTVLSVLRNAQQDIDNVRRWITAQRIHGLKLEACEDLWLKAPRNETCLVQCLIDILFFYEEARATYHNDALFHLLIEEPPGHFDFTVVSAMGVITEGAAGTELAGTYARLLTVRGVPVVRADTATLNSVDYNAEQIQRAVIEKVRTPWGWVGYSQGCANAFRAEALMLQGTPAQRKLVNKFRCRQLLFSAANGSAHGTCGTWKMLRALVDGERFFKRVQAHMSASTQMLGLDLLQKLLCSRVGSAFFGSVQSMTHEGARIMWRDCQHCHWAPSTSIVAVIEDHTLPECLMMLAEALWKQMDYCKHHDTQVAETEAVAHPISMLNSNAEQLKRLDMASAVQRTHHWSPLREEVAFLETERDRKRAVFDVPKDRHIFPWLEVNSRFGVIDRVDGSS